MKKQDKNRSETMNKYRADPLQITQIKEWQIDFKDNFILQSVSGWTIFEYFAVL